MSVYNKVATSDGTVLIDLSGDTVTSASHIVSGYVGHLADGSQVTGTGGGSSSIGTASATPSSTTATSLSFTGLSGEPIAFAIIATANKSLSSGYYWITAITWDGSTYRSTCAYYKSGSGGSRYIYSYSGYASASYSNGTLTVNTGGAYNSAGGSFTNVAYQLIYIY